MVYQYTQFNNLHLPKLHTRDRCVRDHIVVRFTSTDAIWSCEFNSRPCMGRCTWYNLMWNSICQWLGAMWWMSPSTLISSTHTKMTTTILVYNWYIAESCIKTLYTLWWSTLTWLIHVKHKPYILVSPIVKSQEKYCLISSVISKPIQIINVHVIIIFNNCKIPDNSATFIAKQNFYTCTMRIIFVYKIWVWVPI